MFSEFKTEKSAFTRLCLQVAYTLNSWFSQMMKCFELFLVFMLCYAINSVRAVLLLSFPGNI
jgi:hypothetical protein